MADKKTEATHVLIHFRDTRFRQIHLARKSDGMVIGGVQGASAQYGEDASKAVARAFMDTEHALEWLKAQLALEMILDGQRDQLDLWGKPVFEDREGDSRVIATASGVMN